MAAESLLRAYVQDVDSRRLSLSTKKRALRVVSHLLKHLRQQGVRDPRRATLASLQRFAAHLERTRTRQGVALSPASRASYLQAVRGFYRFLERRGDILVSPAQGLVLPRLGRLPREVLSCAQAQRLVETPSTLTKLGQRDRAILEVFYGTGLRLSEVERCDLTDLDLGAGQLLVRNGKGRKDRVVPLTGRALAALDIYLREVRPVFEGYDPSPALFLSSRDGARLSGFALRRLVRTYARRAGITVRVSTHVLRHACATHLLKGGADIRHIQVLLGHKDIATTERYTRVATEDLRVMIERAHPRSRG